MHHKTFRKRSRGKPGSILSRPKLRPEPCPELVEGLVEGRSGGRIEACPEPVEGGAADTGHFGKPAPFDTRSTTFRATQDANLNRY
jgi:hypothetical protein